MHVMHSSSMIDLVAIYLVKGWAFIDITVYIIVKVLYKAESPSILS